MSDLAKLLEHPALWRGNALARVRSSSVSTGSDRLDRELPGGGWPTGALTELLIERQGIGELSLLLPALAQLAGTGRWQTWIAPPHVPYAPNLAASGVDVSRLIVVHPRPPSGATAAVHAPRPMRRDSVMLRDTLWSIEQTLRANLCSAVLAWLPETTAARKHGADRSSSPAPRSASTTTASATYTALRRLQLAAEASETLVALFRPAPAANESSPAALRIALAPAANGRLAVHILKRRGLAAEAPVIVDLKRPHAVDRHYAPTLVAGGLPAQRIGSDVLN